MAFLVSRVTCTFFLAAIFAQGVLASPLKSRLLALVPERVQILMGLERGGAAQMNRSLVFITLQNRLDFDDWQGLVGVDNRRSIHEVIAAARAPSGRLMTEHLLLVTGQFDKERIFCAAERNGARERTFDGETALVIKPFTREWGRMLDTRWLVILDNRIAMFGTELLVKEALQRHLVHAAPDEQLLKRVEQFHPDVISWNIVDTQAVPGGQLIAAHDGNGSGPLQEINMFTLSARAGHRLRIEFSLHARGVRDRAFFAPRANSFAEQFAARVGLEPDANRRRWLTRVEFEPDHVHGFIEVSAQEFRRLTERSNRR